MISDILAGNAPERRWLHALITVGQFLLSLTVLALICVAAPACLVILAAIMGVL